TAEIWVIANKADLLGPSQAGADARLAISATTGRGVDDLISALADFASGFFEATEPVLVTRQRQRQALEDAAAALRRAVDEGAESRKREEVIAEELRLAATALGRVLGRVDVEDVLDAIFRDFCIGK